MQDTASRSSTPTPPSPGRQQLLANSWDESVPWVVQKYGGTSVGKSLDKIGEIVESYLPSNRVAVVCSARSSSTKALGTTNLLLQASKEALHPRSTEACATPLGASGAATPLYPKRVGSGFFSSNGGVEKLSTADGKNSTDKMSSSINSLRDLRLANGPSTRSESPSPFTSSSYFATSSTSSSPTSSGILPPAGSSKPEPDFHATVDILKRDHLAAARKSVVNDQVLLLELEAEIEKDCESLRSFLCAAQIIDEISPKSQDSIVGIGEKLACKIVAASLRDRGIDSELVCLDTIVDATIADAASAAGASQSGDQGVSLLDQSFYDRLAQRLRERILDCGCRVPIITGYFGVVPGSLLAQIGRGYTDLCAALCAVGLQASELQVWKEVDGIFTADPRKVPTARLVPVITPDEAAELTYYGSEVIHPFTMEQVIRAKIPIRIKNVENPKGSGTVIYPKEDREDIPIAGTLRKPAGIKLPTACTIKTDCIVLNIQSNRKSVSHGFLASIFGILDRAGVVVDLISTSQVSVSMAMQSFSSRRRLERVIRELERIAQVTVEDDLVILSLVGTEMRNCIGIAGKMFGTLSDGSVNIRLISQGSRETNISVVIAQADSIKALNLIHQSCLTAPQAAEIPE